jgi:hypothetical protein
MDAIYMSQRDQYLIYPSKIKINVNFNRDLLDKV